MKIQLDDRNWAEPIFGVQCVNGTYDLSWPQIEKLKAFGSKPFQIIKEECENCKKLALDNDRLKMELAETQNIKKKEKK